MQAGKAVIDVAVAVVRNPQNHVLLAERTARQIAAGFWELPGGKIEAGETPAQAAARELNEETDLSALSLQPFMAYEHEFPTKRVRLHIFHVTAWQGAPRGREGQRLAWADPAQPGVAPILPSNTRALSALALPPRLDIIELAGAAPALLARLHAALSEGARLVQVRGDRLAPEQRVAMARPLCLMARDFGARVVLAGSAQEAARAGAAGLHSSAASLRWMAARPPVLLWSVACQDSQDVLRAEALGADMAVLPASMGGGREGAASVMPVYIADSPHHAHRAASGGTASATLNHLH